MFWWWGRRSVIGSQGHIRHCIDSLIMAMFLLLFLVHMTEPHKLNLTNLEPKYYTQEHLPR